ncbi:MAG: hypothetical protein FJZ01_13720 [Candidatus Sericytochromatia bacterium]|nr:hypothetical protein [Candidatus Tanganyikabacteria bacterium]
MAPCWGEWTVSRLVIGDRQGRARITLGIEAGGEPEIRLLDETGQELVRIGLSEASRGLRRNKRPADVSAVLELGSAAQGSMVVTQAGPSGDAFLELASSPGDDAAAVIVQVGRTVDSHVARVGIQDHLAGMEIAVRDGRVVRSEGGDARQP